MRTARLFSSLVALVLAALVLTPPPAQATQAAPAAQAAKPRHDGFALGKEIGETNKFVAYGKWSSYKGKNVKVQRRACGSCAWKLYKRTRTNAKSGWFRTRIEPGDRVGSKVCYRVVVPATGTHRLTRDVAGCITTTRG